MKTIKLILAAAIFTLATTSSFSHTLELNNKTTIYSQDREEIAVSDLPSAVTKAIEADYPDHTITKAFKSTANEKTTYHVVLSKGTESVEVSFDESGTKL